MGPLEVLLSICKCETCAELPEFEHAEMLEHLRTVHGLDAKTTQFARTMLMHIDGDTWYEYQWQWIEKKADGTDGVRFQQLTREMRNYKRRG